MRIAFFQAALTHKRFNENFSVVDRNFGVFPDVGLATAAAVARSWGADVRIWDAYAAQQDVETVLAQMRAWAPDLLATAFHSAPTFRDAIDWATQLRAGLDVPVLMGGHEAGHYPNEVMSWDAVDFLLQGAASVTLPPFLDAFERGGGWDRVAGLGWRDDDDLHFEPAPVAPSLDDEPVPARDLLHNELYYSHVTQRGLYTVLLTSRGCPFTCTFCAVAGSGYHPRPVDEVCDEMADCIDGLGIHEFDIFDPLLLHDRDRALDLCGEIRRRRLDQEWACRSRLDDVDAQLLRAMADAGCKRIYVGIESGDPDVLARIHKRLDLDRVPVLLDMIRDHGIRPLGFFQIGLPGETIASARRTIRFALDLPLDFAQFMRTIAKPHSELEDMLRRVTGTDPWQDYVAGRRDDSRLPTPWTDLAPETVDGLVREAYLRFYMRPRVMARTLRRSRSTVEAARYVRVGLRMLWQRADGI